MATRRSAKANTNNKMSTQNENIGPRSGGTKEISPLEITNDDLSPPSQQDGGNNNNNNNNNNKSSIEEQYHSEREQAKLRHWKESEYAAGLVEPTWPEELEKSKCCCSNREAMNQMFHEEIDPGCGCNYLSALICSRFGAGRIGNMVILKERYVMVEVDDDDCCDEEEQIDGFVDEEDPSSLHQRNNTGSGSESSTDSGDDKNNSSGKSKKRKTVRKREIQFAVGPFWPMLLFITYPLIFGVSALTLHSGIPGKPWYVQLGWALLTAQLIRSLFNTGFRDPGILTRHVNPPASKSNEDDEEGSGRTNRRRIGFRWGNEEGPWRWSDQAQSYRPRNSMYCPDCKVVIEEFDHTCPWTGTAIGKKNMSSFQMFVGLVFVCLIMDIFLLTAGAM